jgi:hypothetical protein
MEPRSLLEEDATDTERALLRAGRADGPSKAATANLLAVMQALPPAPGQPVVAHPMESGLAGSAASVRPAGLVRWVKLGFLAVAVGGLVSFTHYFARIRQIPPSAVPALEKTAPMAAPGEALAPGQAAAPTEVREDIATAHEEDPRLATGENRTRRQRARASARLREATPEASDRSLDRSLGNETRALDRVREALDAHRFSEAMRLIDDYQRSFPQGRLRPESMVLRLAALVQAGKRGAADSLASQLLADETYQTYAPRIRSLLGEAKP